MERTKINSFLVKKYVFVLFVTIVGNYIQDSKRPTIKSRKIYREVPLNFHIKFQINHFHRMNLDGVSKRQQRLLVLSTIFLQFPLIYVFFPSCVVAPPGKMRAMKHNVELATPTKSNSISPEVRRPPPPWTKFCLQQFVCSTRANLGELSMNKRTRLLSLINRS